MLVSVDDVIDPLTRTATVCRSAAASCRDLSRIAEGKKRGPVFLAASRGSLARRLLYGNRQLTLAIHKRIHLMPAHEQTLPGTTDQAAVAGWRELHRALKGGLPHATEIVMLLDSHDLSFPTAPTFDCRHCDLRCYRTIHRAWREGLLPELLRLLQVWCDSDNSLCESARRPQFQQALFAFLSGHRRAGLATLLQCLAVPSPERTAPANDQASVEEVHRRLDALWSDFHHHRRAA
jgi:hypothetical protein